MTPDTPSSTRSDTATRDAGPVSRDATDAAWADGSSRLSGAAAVVEDESCQERNVATGLSR